MASAQQTARGQTNKHAHEHDRLPLELGSGVTQRPAAERRAWARRRGLEPLARAADDVAEGIEHLATLREGEG